jgi:branched-chain amino acid aminotransferase
MTLKVHINGELVDKEDARISVFDHGLLYGDGVFEGMRSYSGSVFRLDEHLDRLWQSAAAIQLKIPVSKEEMAAAVNETLAANRIEDGYIRLVVTRGAGTLGLDPNRCDQPQVIIITDLITLYPDEFYQDGLEIVTARTRRNHPQALDPQIKSLNYLNNILAKIEGLEAGCVEALMLNYQGEVAECTGENIFIVRDQQLLTPPLEAGILHGITRGTVMELARNDGIDVVETTISLDDLYGADECFLTGSAAEVVPVIKVDGNVIGDGTPGPITARLTGLFRQAVQQDAS